MTFSRSARRLITASVLVASVSVVSYTTTRADDDAAAPAKHPKTLQERILETQAGLHDQDLRNNRPQTFVGPDLNDHEKAINVLNRMSFGPTPGMIDEVAEKGWLNWAKEQNEPDKIDDSACEKIVAERFPWVKKTTDMAALEDEFGYNKKLKKKHADDETSIRSQLPQLVLTREIMSKRQFKEMMVEFWREHFTVDQPMLNDEKSRTVTAADYEESVIRKYSFATFKDMLQASAHHPAMLEYLDNQLSKRNEWNENYAREVMELHTLGADRGYTNLDVQELSKVLTGWQYDDTYHFRFNMKAHQPGPKHWLGNTVPEGYDAGKQALDYLADSKPCSQFIAEKLVRYLVNDNPPPLLVTKVAATFRETKGNLPKVYMEIISSKDFISRENYRAKFKPPIYFSVSALRATNAKVDSTIEPVKRLARMGEPVYDCPDPTGYRDVAESWMDAGVLTARWQYCWDLLRGDLGGITVGPEFYDRYKGLKPEEAEAKMIEDLIGGDVGDHELAALKEVAAQEDQRPRMVSIILGSPSFQQR